jgi:hypothetical protein
MVVKQMIEPNLDAIFLADSYGYRPGKSALDAVGVTRKRCWEHDWVLEFDIKGLFDNIDHSLLLKAVRKHVTCPWAVLYIERWLTAPMVMEDGTRVERTCGTPQGGVVSPLLANLFLHYAFDLWMARTHPELPWCRYADDGLVHCQTEQEAQAIMAELQARLAECHLEMHPTKTKIVYCKDGSRKGKYPNRSFDFPGVLLPAAVGEELEAGYPVLELHACGQPSSAHCDAAGDPGEQLPKSDPDRAGGHRSRAQSSPAGLDGVLRTVQSVGAVSGVPAGQQDSGGLGNAEVQPPCGSQDAGESLSRIHR